MQRVPDFIMPLIIIKRVISILINAREQAVYSYRLSLRWR